MTEYPMPVASWFRRLQPPARMVGPAVIVALASGWAGTWMLLRPGGQSTGSYVGQLFGAESILLLSIGLVLISLLPWVETWFDGIDKAAVWHRRVGMTGTLLLIPHVLLAQRVGGSGRSLAVLGALGLAALVIWAIAPRWRAVLPRFLRPSVAAIRTPQVLRRVWDRLGGYERWRSFHRLTGLFVASGFVHGVLDATPFPQAPILRWIYVTIGGIGLAFYAYRELLGRHLVSLHDYQVERVEPLGGEMIEIRLKPLGVPLKFVAGQFAMVNLEGASGWQRHPFSIASPPSSDVVRFTVKALGDETTSMRDSVRPGMPAVIAGPYGRFSHAKGGERQLWIAAGVGVTPFLSWLRALDEQPVAGRVDFFYTSSNGDAPFATELELIAERHKEVRLHLVNSTLDGRLTAEQALAAIADPPSELSVFLSGPDAMLRTFARDLRRAGVPARAIHREHYVWR